jgi:hypothetical protein
MVLRWRTSQAPTTLHGHVPKTCELCAIALQRVEFSAPIKEAYDALAAAGAIKKFGCAESDALRRRNVFVGELRQVGPAHAKDHCAHWASRSTSIQVPF